MPAIPPIESLGMKLTKQDFEAGYAAGLTKLEVYEYALDSALEAHGVPREGRSVKITIDDKDEVQIRITLPEGWYMEPSQVMNGPFESP